MHDRAEAVPGRIRIAPSLLSADLAKLGAEVADVERAGADWIHIDVMDGAFVPNITFGPNVVEAVRRVTALPLDVHLMVNQPERYLATFAEAGASILSIHVEGAVHLERSLCEIRRLGCKAGVVLNPHTPETALEYVLDAVDLVLVMTVNPGFKAQAFLPAQLVKVERVRRLLERRGAAADLEVDGGISAANVKSAVDAGANVIVAGSAIFDNPDRGAALEQLRQALASSA